MLEKTNWIEKLNQEDLSFLQRFVLASGSLKEVAKIYGISYPTVRLRLDRLIQKIEIITDHKIRDPFERRLRLLYAGGKIDLKSYQDLIESYHKSREDKDEEADRIS